MALASNSSGNVPMEVVEDDEGGPRLRTAMEIFKELTANDTSDESLQRRFENRDKAMKRNIEREKKADQRAREKWKKNFKKKTSADDTQ